MDNSDDAYRGIVPPRSLRVEVITDDGRKFQSVYDGHLHIPMPMDIGPVTHALGIEWLKKLGKKFAAMRVWTDDDDRPFIYSIHYYACQFFGVKALTVGQMPIFRAGLVD